MADPVAIVEKIANAALAIAEAVETVRENKGECRDIEQRALRISGILSCLQESETRTKHWVMAGPLEDLEEALRRAHTLVRSCQGRNMLCLLFTAGKLSKQLRQVQDDISQKVMLVILAIHVDKAVQTSSRPLPPPPPRRPSGGGSDDECDCCEPCCCCICLPACMGLAAAHDDDYWFASFFCSGFAPQRRQRPGSKASPPRVPLPGLTEFNLSELEVATNKFSDENKIGSSDFGTVYKGVLMSHEKIVVAIKKFPDPPQSFVSRVYNELRLASLLQNDRMEVLKESPAHDLNVIPDMSKGDNSRGKTNKHLIRILGYCHKAEERLDKAHIFLVEEYMPNGELGNIIYGSHLDWTYRFNIILGIAHGIHYLHEQHVLHLDLKPANILLDANMNPKITNFRIAKPMNEMIARASNIEGTVGYMPPEYVLEGILSMKYDVYSFGIIVLETISGMCISEPTRRQASVKWAWEAREDPRMGELFSPSLCDEPHITVISRCMDVGLLCVQEKLTDRPTMADVLGMLNGNKELPIPHRPEYTKIDVGVRK